jgi:mono/diheme cytochrome c family protein
MSFSASKTSPLPSAGGFTAATVLTLALTLALALFFARTAFSAAAQTPPPAQAASKSPIPNVPILFAKQLNYQGIHIYDTFYQWRPGGGIYILENPADPAEKHRIRPVIDPKTPVTLGPGIYFDPSLSFDAKKILFCHRASPRGNSTIYEINLDGTGLRQITNLDRNGNPYKGTGTGHHDVKPSYLPDGRIVFCSTRYSGLVPCANNGVAILHVANADGSDIHTLSVNNVTEFDPAVMPDGRILFGRWEYIDKNALTIQSLWTVNPSGTNETAFYANNMVFPEAVLQAKPVPGADNLVVATFAPHNAPPRGSIALVNPSVGKNNPAAIKNLEHPNRPTYDRGESCDPWPLSATSILYSGLPDDPNSPRTGIRGRSNARLNAIMHLDAVTGKKTLVLSDPGIDLHNPIPILPRPVPRRLPDTTDRSKITGNFLVVNVYANMPDVPKGSIKWLRVVEETSRVSESPGGTWMNQTFSISAALAWSPKIYHGIVPVEDDGSVSFEAPAGRALYFQLLDKDYRLVRSMRTFIQAAPGVTRSCVGCHEYENAPVTLPIRRRAPRKLADESWGGGHLDYPSMIQPVLDRRCVSCHGGEKGLAGGIDLTGGWTEYFNNSYETLTARREKQYIADLIAGICCMNGTANWSCKIFDPYTHGSGSAPLAKILTKGPHRTINGLTASERELLLAWIDSNGIYYGTWNYTAAGPQIREYPALRNALAADMKAAGCAECHGDNKGNIRRFDNWVNLERPELSLILRAPVAKTDKEAFGLGLCRARKVDQNFTRRGTLFKAGYAHQVLSLDKFPSQKWVPWKESQKGDPVVTFAEGAKTPAYQNMLKRIQDARARILAKPRVDMPDAEFVGKGIVAGRSRQIIPQPLPEVMPPLHVGRTPHGIRLHWECSARTIGLVTEIHRGPAPGFVPSEKTLIGKTERFEFTDKTPPAVGKAHYAIVFVSDPAATCGTFKSGAVLDYQHASDGATPAPSFTPERRRIEDRCPLSMAVPMRSSPAHVTYSPQSGFTLLEKRRPTAESLR